MFVVVSSDVKLFFFFFNQICICSIATGAEMQTFHCFLLLLNYCRHTNTLFAVCHGNHNIFWCLNVNLNFFWYQLFIIDGSYFFHLRPEIWCSKIGYYEKMKLSGQVPLTKVPTQLRKWLTFLRFNLVISYIIVHLIKVGPYCTKQLRPDLTADLV